MTRNRLGGTVGGVVAILSACGVANADISYEVFTLVATVGGESGSFVATTDMGTWDDQGNFYWNLDNPIDIKTKDGSVLATLGTASVTFIADPVIHLNFNVQANNQNTAFSVGSGLLSFPTISNAVGAASAAVSITDVNGNGVTFTPDAAGAHLSHYNGEVPGGTQFASLLNSGFSAGAFATDTASDEFPGGGGFAPIGVGVFDMSARWSFTLTAFDLASGTSVYTIVPAPGSLALLGLGGLAAIRRRR
ncbi:MAG TPA: PEP-CTERM sorting domain-containing protein [Phycisphaerales bacterium]|nr:PEP-CTERM sorting domain-containing protein [Phycisphaerales bacterium]